MWTPVTPGEEVFLSLYTETESLQKALKGGLYESLVMPERFSQFTRIAATLEVLIRLLGVARKSLAANPSASPVSLKSSVNHEGIELPLKLTCTGYFWEALRSAAENFLNEESLRNSLKSIATPIYRSHRSQCYLCGVQMTHSKTNLLTHRSIDHIWPISLGGSNHLDNLLPACVDCNSKKGGTVTWAWGPIQSTREIAAGGNLSNNLRLSFGLARMMLYAERHKSSRGVTLKDSVKHMFPACIPIELRQDRHEVYFEIFQRIEANVWSQRQ